MIGTRRAVVDVSVRQPVNKSRHVAESSNCRERFIAGFTSSPDLTELYRASTVTVSTDGHSKLYPFTRKRDPHYLGMP